MAQPRVQCCAAARSAIRHKRPPLRNRHHLNKQRSRNHVTLPLLRSCAPHKPPELSGMPSAITLVAARGERMARVRCNLSGLREVTFLFGRLGVLFLVSNSAFLPLPLLSQTASAPQYPALPSETPARL